MSQFETAGHEVVDRDVKTTGNGAYVSVPKRWLGEDGGNVVRPRCRRRAGTGRLIRLDTQNADSMRVRDWDDILERVVESDADPDGWRAVAGDRERGVGEDMFIGHPSVGVFQLKTYAKNPFEVRGVGTRVARRIDDDLDPLFPAQADGRFGVQSPITDEDEAEETARDLEAVLEAHSEAPTRPHDLFDDIMDTLDSPAFGPIEYDQYDRPDPLDELTDTFDEAEDLLTSEFEDVVEEDDVGRGFY